MSDRKGFLVRKGIIMDIKENWTEIRKHFNVSFRSNFHVSIASVDDQNMPTVTPIGSLFLNDDQGGFYFEKFPALLPEHAKSNKNICALAVNSGTWFWIKSLLLGKFKSYPGIKLYGQLGERRKATDKEIARLNRRMKASKGLPGNTFLWGRMEYIREVHFSRVEKIHLGKMTAEL